jgi:hypothetical protein
MSQFMRRRSQSSVVSHQQAPQAQAAPQQVQRQQVRTQGARFFGDPMRVEPTGPERLYARVDTVEQVAPDEIVVLFDGVFANWFDNQGLSNGPIPAGVASEMPVAVVEFSFDPNAGSEHEFPIGAWFVVDLGYDDKNATENLYLSLFDDPIAVVARFERTSSEFQASLISAFSLEDTPDAHVFEIEKLLPSGQLHIINVLDIGQGNATALSDENGEIAMYFDFGGGVLANARTFPKKHAGFCLSPSIPIVLSHWDWDHWSSGLRNAGSLNCKWIVPRQPLGATHKKFAAQLASRGNLLIWPSGHPVITRGQIRTIACSGADQNNSGLAMIVSTPRDSKQQRYTLLPGDADYRFIHGGAFGNIHGLIASHHGARVGSKAAAPPMSKGCLVYSYGHGNSFGHPRLHAELDYLTWNWMPDRTMTTTQSRRRRPCNVAINLLATATPISCPSCSPVFSETI